MSNEIKSGDWYYDIINEGNVLIKRIEQKNNYIAIHQHIPYNCEKLVPKQIFERNYIKLPEFDGFQKGKYYRYWRKDGIKSRILIEPMLCFLSGKYYECTYSSDKEKNIALLEKSDRFFYWFSLQKAPPECFHQFYQEKEMLEEIQIENLIKIKMEDVAEKTNDITIYPPEEYQKIFFDTNEISLKNTFIKEKIFIKL